jgi:NarL family two-component system response regulator LiaR
MSIKVFIADDHNMVRSGLAMFLDAFEEFELVGQADNGEAAVRLCRETSPDVVLMDLMMHGLDGITAIKQIVEDNAEVRIIALTSFKDEAMVRAALQAGAISYLLKSASIQDLAQAIRDAFRGRSTLSPEAMHSLVMSTRSAAPTVDQLTEREREVLAHMVAGLTNRQIAGKLSVGLSTIKFHVSSILSKLNAVSRTEAVALAMQHKLID